jgi:hypothetical protein
VKNQGMVKDGAIVLAVMGCPDADAAASLVSSFTRRNDRLRSFNVPKMMIVVDT